MDIAIIPEMPGMAPNIAPVNTPKAMAPMDFSVSTEVNPVMISAIMKPPENGKIYSNSTPDGSMTCMNSKTK